MIQHQEIPNVNQKASVCSHIQVQAWIFHLSVYFEVLDSVASYPNLKCNPLPSLIVNLFVSQTIEWPFDGHTVIEDHQIDALIAKKAPVLWNKAYQYQKEGIRYDILYVIVDTDSFGVRSRGRFLLADMMGLGKTLQAIGILYPSQYD